MAAGGYLWRSVLGGAAQVIGTEQCSAGLGSNSSRADERAGERFEFEVASVRLNEKWKFADPGYSLDSDDNYVPGESLFIADGPLSTFIGFAYKLDLLNSMIANLPKWANDQSYEIRRAFQAHRAKIRCD